MSTFKTVFEYGESEIIIEKSKFIGYCKPVSNEEEANEFINSIKKLHRNATHNVPVYLLGEKFNIQKYSDDGEPSGTAGLPVLEMLKKEGITNIAMVITRYFGGIKLGTGGLVRAYTSSAKETLQVSKIVEKKLFDKCSISLDYTLHGKVNNFLLNSHYIDGGTNFTDKVEMIVYCEKGEFEELKSKIIDLTNSNGDIYIIKEEYITLMDGQIVEYGG
ncbi:MAG: YigZ family protein [Firmicutes bacterium]|jgi:uncharacterized YigZ family protein|nr:YigZ family protein [Bacillota bacterium]